MYNSQQPSGAGRRGMWMGERMSLMPTWSALSRAALAFAFIFATLAAGHLLMVVINTLDHSISTDVYAASGPEGRWFGDWPISSEIQALAGESQGTHRDAVQNLAATGDEPEFSMLPVSPFLVFQLFVLVAIGGGLLLVSRWVRGDAVQSLLGVFAGLFIWTGAVEYGLVIAARLLGVAKSIKLHGGELIGVHGEYVLLKHTWGLLVVVLTYVLFLESNRCPFFLWFRRRLSLMRGSIATGRIDNYGPRTAFQYITIMWTFYVLLLWAYDESVFGVNSWFTHTVFFGSFAATGYMFLRLVSQASFGGALRYAIGTAIIFWNTIEIAAKWGLFREPWLVLNPATAIVFFGGAILGTWLVVREIRRAAAERITPGAA